MAFLEDVVDWITGEITTIGLATGPNEADEVSGNGYAPLSPTYADANEGSADITATLEFDGPENLEGVSHLIFRNAVGVWTIREADAPQDFNSDGRLNLTSAPIDQSFVGS